MLLRTALIVVGLLLPQVAVGRQNAAVADLSSDGDQWLVVRLAPLRPPPVQSPVQSRVPQPAVQSGANTHAMTTYVGASDIDPSGRESAQPAVGLDLSTRLNHQTDLAISFVHGPADVVSDLALAGMYRPTIRTTLKRPTWKLTGGDFSSAQHVLAGPVLRADGVAIEVNRRLVASLTIARPKYFGGGGGGHLIQGRLGFRSAAGTFALLASDLSRPHQLSRTIGDIRVVEPHSQADVEILDDVRRLLSRENRVRGGGVEVDLRTAAQTVVVRAGWMELVSHTGARSSGAAGEARYTFNHSNFLISAYARRTPASVVGAYARGDALSIYSRARVIGDFKLFVQGYSTRSWLLGHSRAVRSEGASTGIQHGDGTNILSIQANVRQLTSATLPRVARTITARAARSVGAVTFEAQAEAGENERGSDVRPFRMYRARLTGGTDALSVWVMGTHADDGFQTARTRADIGGDVTVGRALFEAGVGYGEGQVLGDIFNWWGSVELPLMAGLTGVASVDYLRWDHTASPYLVFLRDEDQTSPWRVSIALRHKLPFGSASPTSAPRR